jgi:hypothetical protein
MPAEEPDIANPAEWPKREFRYGISRIISRVVRIVERYDAQIDLAHFKASHLDIEIEIEQRQLLQLFRQQRVVPAGVLGQPVVGDHEGAGLGRI